MILAIVLISLIFLSPFIIQAYLFNRLTKAAIKDIHDFADGLYTQHIRDLVNQYKEKE
jgi:hypothetical protein